MEEWVESVEDGGVDEVVCHIFLFDEGRQKIGRRGETVQNFADLVARFRRRRTEKFCKVTRGWSFEKRIEERVEGMSKDCEERIEIVGGEEVFREGHAAKGEDRQGGADCDEGVGQISQRSVSLIDGIARPELGSRFLRSFLLLPELILLHRRRA